MSGYRSLHREQVGEVPVWQVQSSVLQSKKWCLWTASADGCVRAYRVQDKDDAAQHELDASALSLKCTHVFLGPSQMYPPTTALLGCSQISIGRNYVGEDDMAGDFVVTSLDLTGRVRVWTFAPELFDDVVDDVKRVKASHEFTVQGATGTIMAYCPPNLSGNGNVALTVACLDGTVAMVATGLVTPKATKEPSPAGAVLDKWGSGSIAMSMAWHPTLHTLVVGRKDGLVDILSSSKKNPHRLVRHGTPVRAVAYTPDAQLLVTGSDEGLLCVWDVHRKVPTLVHHVVQAHDSWITSISMLIDSRRFVTCGADRKLHVWSVGQMYAPMHTFQSDGTVWTTHITSGSQRLLTGSEDGIMQIYSLEG